MGCTAGGTATLSWAGLLTWPVYGGGLRRGCVCESMPGDAAVYEPTCVEAIALHNVRIAGTVELYSGWVSQNGELIQGTYRDGSSHASATKFLEKGRWLRRNIVELCF